MPAHYVRQGQGAVQVVGIILHGFFHRFPDCFVAGEVNYRVKAVRVKNPFHGRPVADIRLVENRSLSGNLSDPVHSFSACVVKIVGNDHFMPGFKQFHTGMAADVTGASRNENIHPAPSRIRQFLEFYFTIICLRVQLSKASLHVFPQLQTGLSLC